MHIKYESQLREPLVYGNKDYHQVTEDIPHDTDAQLIPALPLTEQLNDLPGLLLLAFREVKPRQR